MRDADPEVVIDAIKVAGLANQKGPRIQQVLRAITAERGSLNLDFFTDLPVEEARAWLTKFNGVSPKTAAIVLCFCARRAHLLWDARILPCSGQIDYAEKMTVEQAHPHLK